jgi:hypothetical protein
MPTKRFSRHAALAACAVLGVSLVSAYGASAASKLPAPKLDDPNKTAAAVGPTAVTLTWSAVTGADHYIVRRETNVYAKVSDDGDGKGKRLSNDTADIATDVAMTSYTDGTFPPSNATQTTYVSYKVRAVSSGGKEGNGSNQVEVKVPRPAGTGPLTAPGKPTGFTSTTHPVTISFTFAPATGGVAPVKYVVRRTGGEAPTEEFTTSTASFTDTSSELTTKQTFTYKVKAIDAVGTISAVGPSATYKIK